MATNRDYTGLVRTPSSMAWLIKKRACIQGQWDRRRALLARLPGEIAAYESQLQALDKVIPLHEVQVDPVKIKGRRPRRKNLGRYGILESAVLQFLRDNARRPVSTGAVTAHVVTVVKIDLTVYRNAQASRAIGEALMRLRAKGLVASRPSDANPNRVLWFLADQPSEP